MNTKHTPGPWSHFILDRPLTEVPAYVEKCISASPGTDFYFVLAKDDSGEWDIAHIGNGRRSLENARLIAAAPDLLDALILLVRTHDEPAESLIDEVREMRWLEKARAAILKATGEQQ